MTTTPAIQRRTVGVLATGQVLAGLGQGAVLSIGAVLAANMAGNAFAGAATTATTLGAALASIPLARMAQRLGRRPALALGALAAGVGSVLTVVAAGIPFFPLLILGFALLGVGTSVGLQARFAATDVAATATRGRDLSIVVWSTTVGAVVGPNLFGPGVVIADTLGLPENTGSFVIAITAQLLAAVLYLVALRPDPLLLSRTLPTPEPTTRDAGALLGRGTLVFAVTAVALSHAVMVSIMAMTPVHLTSHGASLTVVGFTISLHVAGMFALAPVFGWASDKFGRIPTILVGQVMLAIAVVLNGLGSNDTAVVAIALTVLGLGWSAATVAGSALVTDLVTGDARVRIQGRTDTIMSLSGAIGAGFAGPVLAIIGYDGLAWGAGVLVLGVAVSAVLVGGRMRAGRA